MSADLLLLVLGLLVLAVLAADCDLGPSPTLTQVRGHGDALMWTCPRFIKVVSTSRLPVT